MTNSNDFRRYSYSTEAASALHAFDMRSSAAPSYVPEPKRDLRVHENEKKKSLNELHREQKSGLLRSLQIFGIAVVCIAMLGAVLFSNAKKNELNHEINAVQKDIKIANSENIRLNSELNTLFSLSMLDQYATEKLGMTKMRSSQIHYIDVSQFKEARGASSSAQSNSETPETLEE